MQGIAGEERQLSTSFSKSDEQANDKTSHPTGESTESLSLRWIQSTHSAGARDYATGQEHLNGEFDPGSG